MRQSLAAAFSRTLSLVRFESKSCGIAAIPSLFQGNTAEFLCRSDCMAERGGFELSVRFRNGV